MDRLRILLLVELGNLVHGIAGLKLGGTCAEFSERDGTRTILHRIGSRVDLDAHLFGRLCRVIGFDVAEGSLNLRATVGSLMHSGLFGDVIAEPNYAGDADHE